MDFLEYNEASKNNMLYKIKEYLERYINDNNIKTKIKNEENVLNKVYQYFTVIIDIKN